MAKAKRKPKRKIEREDITPERASRNEFVSAGMARRSTIVLTAMWNKGDITAHEWAGLMKYRDYANQAEEDHAQSSTLDPKRIMGGNSGCSVTSGPLPTLLATTPAGRETARLETLLRAQGDDYRDIARAIAVDNITLTQFCIDKYGGREERERGVFVRIVPRGTDSVAYERDRLREAGRILYEWA